MRVVALMTVLCFVGLRLYVTREHDVVMFSFTLSWTRDRVCSVLCLSCRFRCCTFRSTELRLRLPLTVSELQLHGSGEYWAMAADVEARRRSCVNEGYIDGVRAARLEWLGVFIYTRVYIAGFENLHLLVIPSRKPLKTTLP